MSHTYPPGTTSLWMSPIILPPTVEAEKGIWHYDRRPERKKYTPYWISEPIRQTFYLPDYCWQFTVLQAYSYEAGVTLIEWTFTTIPHLRQAKRNGCLWITLAEAEWQRIRDELASDKITLQELSAVIREHAYGRRWHD